MATNPDPDYVEWQLGDVHLDDVLTGEYDDDYPDDAVPEGVGTGCRCSSCASTYEPPIDRVDGPGW